MDLLYNKKISDNHRSLMSNSGKYAENAKNKGVCRSCIMAGEQRYMNRFLDLGAKKIGSYKVNNAFVVEIPVDRIEKFVELYTGIMKPGYWNKYLGPKTGFFFKTTAGQVKHIPLTPENARKINQTMRDEFIPD